MTPQEYLCITAPLVAEYQAKIEPFVKKRLERILRAESWYKIQMSREPKFAFKARAMPDERVGQMLLGYLHKWHEQDAEEEMAATKAEIEAQYDRSIAPIKAEHDRRVEELICQYQPS